MINNAIPYFIFTSLIFLLFLFNRSFTNSVVINKSISIICSYLLFCLMISFLGLRGYIGADWVFYYPYYENAPTFFDKNILTFIKDSNYGIGYGFWNILIKTTGAKYIGFQFANVFFHFFVINDIFKYYCKKYFVLAWFFFFSFNGLDIEILYLRNSTAIFLFIYSLRYADSKQLLKYFLVNFIGILFHTSALVYLPLYFFFRLNRNKLIERLFFCIGCIVFFLRINWLIGFLNIIAPFLPMKIQVLIKAYTLSTEFSSAYAFSLGMLERFISFFILYFYSDRLLLYKPVLKNFWYLFLLYMGTYLYCAEFGIFIARITVLFIPCYWILLPNLYAILSKNRKQLFLLFYISYALLRVFNAMQVNWAFYENILTGISSMSVRRTFYFPKKN